jgi:hypothetical protein
MKITLECTECLRLVREDGLQINPMFQVPLGEKTTYHATCPRGHSVRQLVENPKFELLFESGINALRDGYHREAVTSFAASLERFQEFLIRSHFMPADQSNVLPVAFFDSWKVLSKQSERQLGAFQVLYLIEFNESAPLFDINFIKSLGLILDKKGNDPVHFRNRIIHQGYIPQYEQAMAYGEAVNKYIFNLLVEYCRKGAVVKLHMARSAEVKQQLDGANSGTNSITLVSTGKFLYNLAVNKEVHEYVTLKDYMAITPNPFQKRVY